MKKLFAITALAMASTVAVAGPLSGTVRYDYDRGANVNDGTNFHKVGAGLAYDFGKYGVVDGVLSTVRVETPGLSEDGVGYELGYSKTVKFGKVDVMGRVAYENHRFNLATQGADRDAVKAKVEASMPVRQNLRGFASFEHVRTKFEVGAASTEGRENRTAVGVDYAVTPALSVRGGYVHTNVAGSSGRYSGVVAAVNYKF